MSYLGISAVRAWTLKRRLHTFMNPKPKDKWDVSWLVYDRRFRLLIGVKDDARGFSDVEKRKN